MFHLSKSGFAPCFAAAFALLLLCACGERRVPAEIHFAVSGGLSCSDTVNDLLLTDLRFYVHDVALLDESGREVFLRLTPDSQWQDDRVALLDFEDGQGACENGSAAMNTSVRGTVPDGVYRGAVFTLGVPNDLNHADPMLAAAPLNVTPMHWHWLTGYKFLRAGVTNGTDGFWLHLGSSHCDGSISEGIECRSPNRVTVRLERLDIGKDRIAMDLGELFRGVDLADGVVSDCSSGPAEESCVEPFRALGLDSGAEAAAPSRQTRVFRSETDR